jgi:hypothetical protein
LGLAVALAVTSIAIATSTEGFFWRLPPRDAPFFKTIMSSSIKNANANDTNRTKGPRQENIRGGCLRIGAKVIR